MSQVQIHLKQFFDNVFFLMRFLHFANPWSLCFVESWQPQEMGCCSEEEWRLGDEAGDPVSLGSLWGAEEGEGRQRARSQPRRGARVSGTLRGWSGACANCRFLCVPVCVPWTSLLNLIARSLLAVSASNILLVIADFKNTHLTRGALHLNP